MKTLYQVEVQILRFMKMLEQEKTRLPVKIGYLDKPVKIVFFTYSHFFDRIIFSLTLPPGKTIENTKSIYLLWRKTKPAGYWSCLRKETLSQESFHLKNSENKLEANLFSIVKTLFKKYKKITS